MLLVISLIAVTAVVALGMLANRYARLHTPMRSVMDLGPATGPVPTPPGPAPEASVVPEAPVRESEEPEPPPGPAEQDASSEGPSPETVARVEQFEAGRRAVIRFLEEHPHAARQWKDEITGQEDPQGRIKMLAEQMAQLRLARWRGLQEVGMEEDDYREVRDHYLAWIEGQGGVDSELAAAFESRREEMEQLHLDVLEPFDP